MQKISFKLSSHTKTMVIIYFQVIRLAFRNVVSRSLITMATGFLKSTLMAIKCGGYVVKTEL